MMPTFNIRRTKTGFRSQFEERLVEHLKNQNITAHYEPFFIRFRPQSPKRYTPDIVLANGIIIEAKGYFFPEDRTKHKDVKAAYPDLDIRFVFERAKNKLSHTSKTTYGAWCEREGFLYAEGKIPESWLNEPPEPKRLKAIEMVAIQKKKTKSTRKSH